MSLPRRQTLSTCPLISSNLPGLNYKDIFLAWPIPQNIVGLRAFMLADRMLKQKRTLPQRLESTGQHCFSIDFIFCFSGLIASV